MGVFPSVTFLYMRLEVTFRVVSTANAVDSFPFPARLLVFPQTGLFLELFSARTAFQNRVHPIEVIGQATLGFADFAALCARESRICDIR